MRLNQIALHPTLMLQPLLPIRNAPPRPRTSLLRAGLGTLTQVLCRDVVDILCFAFAVVDAAEEEKAFCCWCVSVGDGDAATRGSGGCA